MVFPLVAFVGALKVFLFLEIAIRTDDSTTAFLVVGKDGEEVEVGEGAEIADLTLVADAVDNYNVIICPGCRGFPDLPTYLVDTHLRQDRQPLLVAEFVADILELLCCRIGDPLAFGDFSEVFRQLIVVCAITELVLEAMGDETAAATQRADKTYN